MLKYIYKYSKLGKRFRQYMYKGKNISVATYKNLKNPTKISLPKRRKDQSVKLYKAWNSTTPENFIRNIFESVTEDSDINITFKNGNRIRFLNKVCEEYRKRETAKYAIDLFYELFLTNNHSNGNIKNVYPIKVTVIPLASFATATKAIIKAKETAKQRKKDKKKKQKIERSEKPTKPLRGRPRYYEEGGFVYNKKTKKKIGKIVDGEFKKL